MSTHTCPMTGRTYRVYSTFARLCDECFSKHTKAGGNAEEVTIGYIAPQRCEGCGLWWQDVNQPRRPVMCQTVVGGRRQC